MSTDTTIPASPTAAPASPAGLTPDPFADGKRQLDLAIERLMQGIRDPEVGRKAREEMDRMRAETQARIGIVEVAVDLIREARDA